jgi:hypothetical protein
MPTSGTYTFNLSIAELIEEAYERCGIEAVNGYDLASGQRSLDLLLQDWSNRKLNLWTVEEFQIPLVKGQATYTLPSYAIDILEASIRQSGVDYSTERMSRKFYAGLPQKSQEGRPSHYLVTRLAVPTVTLWQTPDTTGAQLRMNLMRRIQDVGAFSNTPDVVSRYLPALAAGLAFFIAMKRAPERAELLNAFYEQELRRAADEDVERVSFHAVPARGYLRV